MCSWAEDIFIVVQVLPTLGTVKSLKVLAGYLKKTVSQKLGGSRLLSMDDHFSIFTDSDHHGDKLMTSKSQTGVLVLLNGIPVHWRSNKQPVTADSPACAEIYALKEGVRDSRLLLWVADEMGIAVSWPFVVNCDSKQAISFQQCEKRTNPWRTTFCHKAHPTKKILFPQHHQTEGLPAS